MEEKIQYYENSLIPIFKKKLYEAQIVIPELEANILFLRNRVSQLLNSKGADGLQDESTNIKKNVNKKKM